LRRSRAKELQELEALAGIWKERRAVPQDTRIVGGIPAEEGEFPWAVAFLYWKASEGRWAQYCGGSLISPQWVLTAAHCPVSSNHRALLGRLDLTESGGEVLRIVDVISHESYDRDTHDSDISLVKLETTSASAPVPLLAGEEATTAGEQTTVIGWGHTEEGGSASNELRKVDVAFVDPDQCKDSYETVTENMLCAGEDGKDSCQGDSGGGLLVYDPDEKTEEYGYSLAGVVSFGRGCARPEFPGVYTKVSNYQDWIEENTGQ
jgi:secreted trypsin-like serine protease